MVLLCISIKKGGMGWRKFNASREPDLNGSETSSGAGNVPTHPEKTNLFEYIFIILINIVIKKLLSV
jgi:hypothetical protein